MNIKKALSLPIVCSMLYNSLYATPALQCLFAHGMFDSSKQANKYVQAFQPYRICAFDFPDSKKHFPWVRPKHVNFGQEGDVACLKSYYETLDKENSILFGISRGGVTAFNFVALENPPVKALITESPYDMLKNVIHDLPVLSHLGIKSYRWLPYIFKKHVCGKMQPAHTLQSLNKNIPILMICSKEDRTVPYKYTVSLYKKLKERGHQYVHILILDQGKHAKLIDGKDGIRYQTVLHAFLKQYNLPHNSNLASKGHADFAKTQPLSHTL